MDEAKLLELLVKLGYIKKEDALKAQRENQPSFWPLERIIRRLTVKLVKNI